MVKIAYVGWTEPGVASGATLALQRHLYQNAEFDVLVATDKPHKGVGPEDRWIHLKRSWLHHRLSRTRLRCLVAQYEMLLEPYLFLQRIKTDVARFKPDIILTIPDNTISWTACHLARKLRVPLVCNFQDWWPRGQFWAWHEGPWGPVLGIVENRMRHLFRESVVAFCTSEGFQRFLGPHPDAPLLYPCPAPRPSSRPIPSLPAPDRPLRVIYGGTLVRYYGKSLLALAKSCIGEKDIELRLYGSKPDWPDEDIAWATEAGIYRGQLSHEAYRSELAAGDIFLTVMSGAPELRTMMETSFTTKFLEYCQFAKPVVVWGPGYCQPVLIAKATGAGLDVTSEDPAAVVAAIKTLRVRQNYSQLADGAWTAATTIFDPSSIHEVFRRGVERAVKPGQNA